MSITDIKTRLRKILALRAGVEILAIRRVESVRGTENNPKYTLEFRLQLTNGAIVCLGTASEVIKFGKVQQAFAESFGHVIPSKESKNWDETAQLFFDLFYKYFRDEKPKPLPEPVSEEEKLDAAEAEMLTDHPPGTPAGPSLETPGLPKPA